MKPLEPNPFIMHRGLLRVRILTPAIHRRRPEIPSSSQPSYHLRRPLKLTPQNAIPLGPGSKRFGTRHISDCLRTGVRRNSHICYSRDGTRKSPPIPFQRIFWLLLPAIILKHTRLDYSNKKPGTGCIYDHPSAPHGSKSSHLVVPPASQKVTPRSFQRDF